MKRRVVSAAAVAMLAIVGGAASCRADQSNTVPAASTPVVEPTEITQRAEPGEDGLDQALGWQYVIDVDRGFEIDGSFTSTGHVDANKLRWTFHADPEAQYVYSARDSSLKPGDELCLERLQLADVQFERSLGSEPAEFVAFDGPDQLTEPLRYPVPVTVAEWWELVSIEPPATQRNERTAELSAAQIQRVLAVLPSSASDLARYQSGRLTTIESESSELQSIVVQADFVGVEEPVEGFTGSIYQVAEAEQLNAMFRVLGVESFEPRLDENSAVAQGACSPRSAWLAGEWQLYAVFPFDPEQGNRIILERDQRTGLLRVEADGSFSGTIGCSMFSGTADVDFFTFGGASLVLDSDCELSEAERLVIAAFQDGELVADTAGQLIVLAEDPVTGTNVAGAMFLPRSLLEIDFS